MSNRGETLIAVQPSTLARNLCRYCVGCLPYDRKRETPLQCSKVRRFIDNVTYKNNNQKCQKSKENSTSCR